MSNPPALATQPTATAIRTLIDGAWHTRRTLLREIAMSIHETTNNPTRTPTAMPFPAIAPQIQRPALDLDGPTIRGHWDNEYGTPYIPTRLIQQANRVLTTLTNHGYITVDNDRVRLTEHALDKLFPGTTPQTWDPSTRATNPHTEHPHSNNTDYQPNDNRPKAWTLAVIRELINAPANNPVVTREKLLQVAESYVPDKRAIEVANTRARAEIRRGKRVNMPTEHDAIIYGRRYIARQTILATARYGWSQKTDNGYTATARLREAWHTEGHPLTADPGAPAH